MIEILTLSLHGVEKSHARGVRGWSGKIGFFIRALAPM